MLILPGTGIILVFVCMQDTVVRKTFLQNWSCCSVFKWLIKNKGKQVFASQKFSFFCCFLPFVAFYLMNNCKFWSNGVPHFFLPNCIFVLGSTKPSGFGFQQPSSKISSPGMVSSSALEQWQLELLLPFSLPLLMSLPNVAHAGGKLVLCLKVFYDLSLLSRSSVVVFSKPVLAGNWMLLRFWHVCKLMKVSTLPPPAFFLWEWRRYRKIHPRPWCVPRSWNCCCLSQTLMSYFLSPMLLPLSISWQASFSHKNVIPPLHWWIQSRPSYYGLLSQLLFPRQGTGGKLTPCCPGRNISVSLGWYKLAVQ